MLIAVQYVFFFTCQMVEVIFMCLSVLLQGLLEELTLCQLARVFFLALTQFNLLFFGWVVGLLIFLKEFYLFTNHNYLMQF